MSQIMKVGNIQDVNNLLARAVFFLLKDTDTGIVVCGKNNKKFSIYREGFGLSFSEIEDENISDGTFLIFKKEEEKE